MVKNEFDHMVISGAAAPYSVIHGFIGNYFKILIKKIDFF